jgi:hypothetical protein
VNDCLIIISKARSWNYCVLQCQIYSNALISQIYFWNEILHVSDSFSVHRQEFFTVHTAMVYVCYTGLLTAYEQNQGGTQFHPDPARKLSAKIL